MVPANAFDSKIESTVRRIDDKFKKLNLNLKKYTDILNPARDLIIEENAEQAMTSGRQIMSMTDQMSAAQTNTSRNNRKDTGTDKTLEEMSMVSVG